MEPSEVLRLQQGDGRKPETAADAILDARATAPRLIETEELSDAAKALRRLVDEWVLPSALAGTTLDPNHLSDEEGAALRALVRRLLGRRPARDRRRPRASRGVDREGAAAPIFKSLAIEEELTDWLEQERRAKLPKKRAPLEAGAVVLPSSAFDELRKARAPIREATAPDLAALGVG